MITGPELLSREHNVDEFDCGKPSLNDWLQRYAMQNQRGDATRTYVVHRDQRVIGYYSLCPTSIARAITLPRILKGLGRHEQVPAILLARLAIDVGEQGQHLGSALLKEAILQAISGADAIGGRAILVHAIDDDAERFYQHFGFEASTVAEHTLMLLMKDARAAMK